MVIASNEVPMKMVLTKLLRRLNPETRPATKTPV